MSHLFRSEPNQYDAFGRLRTSSPVTLFDAFNRYGDSGKFATYTSGTATSTHNQNTGAIECTIGTGSGDAIYRETTRVFAYQPGKSLLIMNTFVFPAAKTNLRIRYGYFSTENGIFLQQSGTQVSLVRRSIPSGVVTESVVNKQDWLYDKMDGTGPSGHVLDLTKTQIFWMDIEWLGVGSVRCGFVINGQFIHCHSFHHANIIPNTYMQTACLPIRYEIENTGTTSSSSTLQQICSTVITEGGYEIAGRSRTAGTVPNSPRTLTTAGTYYPIVSLRLKSTRLDGIVAPVAFSAIGVTPGNYRYVLEQAGTVVGGTWISAGIDSNIEYNLTATSLSGGTQLSSGYFSSSNQSTGSVQTVSDLFRYQLQRNSFTNTAETYTLSLASDGAGDTVLGSIDWQEIT